MYKKGKLIIGLFFFLLFLGCIRDKADVVIAEINLNEQLSLAIRESFTTQGYNSILARITSSTEYDCQDGILRNTVVKTEDDEILINIIGLELPPLEECDERDVAAVDVVLGDLNLNQTYQIQVSLLSQIKNSGVVINRDDRIVLSLETDSKSGIIVENTTVFKIPFRTVWGFIDSEVDLQDSIQQSFVDQMELLGNPIAKIGPYGNFEIGLDKAAKIYDFENSMSVNKIPGFAINYTGDFDELTALAEEEFCGQQDIRIRIWDTLGNRYFCN